jgi:hypothetical protein
MEKGRMEQRAVEERGVGQWETGKRAMGEMGGRRIRE